MEHDAPLTAAEVGVMLDPPVSGRTVTRRAEAGELPYLRKLPGPNGDYLFHPDAVGQYIADQAEAAKASA
jgi:hypothetical protein